MNHSMRFLFASIVVLLPINSLADWPDFPFVFAHGEASKDVAPDKATISYYVVSFHKNSADAQQIVQTTVGETLQLLRDLNISEDAMKLKSLGIMFHGESK